MAPKPSKAVCDKLRRAASMYPGAKMTDAGIVAMSEELASYGEARVLPAIDVAIRSCEFFPTVAAISKNIRETIMTESRDYHDSIKAPTEYERTHLSDGSSFNLGEYLREMLKGTKWAR